VILDNNYKVKFTIPIKSSMTKEELRSEIRKMILNYQLPAYFEIDRKKKIEFLLNF